jgi:hypothetical protein
MRSIAILLAFSGFVSVGTMAPTREFDVLVPRNIFSSLDADAKSIVDELVPADSDLESNPYLAKREAGPLTLRDVTSALDAETRAAIAEIVGDADTLKDNPYLAKRESAKLYWGPVYIGNLKLTLTNPHVGYAGPRFPNANHVNFHVDKKAPKNKWTAVVNMHIVKYTRGGKFCLYSWDSVTSKVVFDNCFDSLLPAIKKCVEAIKDFVDTLLKNANWIASIAIIAALVVVLVAALTSLGAVALA